MVAALFISLLILLVLGVPVFVSLGLSSLIAVAGFSDFPLMIIVQRMIGGVDKFSLMAIPFFILAANVMKTGGIARRILDWAGCMVGHQRGGMAVTTEVACMFFGAVSGSSPATVLAIGGLTYPKMVEQGYPKSFSTGLITSSGSVALLIPPSISAIVYCSVTGASVGALFMAGLGAGLLYGICFLLYCIWYAKKHKATPRNIFDDSAQISSVRCCHNIPKAPKTSGRERWKITKDAAWALGVPVIIIGGIYAGIFTPTEAAGVSAVYAIIVSLFIYKEMTLKQLWECCVASAGTTAQVMILLAAASAFGYVLTIGQVPQMLSALIVNADLSRVGFLLMVNLLMILEGMFIDGSSAIIITAPLLYNAALGLGIDPVHFGVIMVANAAIGMFTPPFGLNLFVAQPVTGNNIKDIMKGVLPFVAIAIFALMLITYIEPVSMIFPRLLYG